LDRRFGSIGERQTPMARERTLRARRAGTREISLGRLRAVNITRDVVVASALEWAGTSESRRRGLLGRTSFEKGEGLYLVPCPWVHTFGMAFPIDVALLAKDGRVLHVHRGLAPGRLSRLAWRAEGTLELPAGTLVATGTSLGDVIRFDEADESP
jgi:uncharacterized membrane protein (UPF0127 family)